MCDYQNTNVSVLMGKLLSHVNGEVGDGKMVFVTENGETYELYHEQDCCESVTIEDIVGDLEDLVGSPITMSEEVSNYDGGNPPSNDWDDSCTWTFYRFATVKGYVTVRWLGTSNGYYSERVDFRRVD